MQDKDYLNILISLKALSRPVLRKLKILFKTWRDVFINLNNENLIKLGINDKKIKDIIIAKQNIDIGEVLGNYKKHQISYLSLEDMEYPYLLKQIVDPPLLLYIKGDIPKATKYISIVGTRRSTFYGEDITQLLAENLSKKGITIISGLAFGIDAVAHSNSMENIGKTIAVLGSSLEKFSPVGNQKLADKIIENKGCVISEYPLITPPSKYNFPERNRIIAGMSDAVIVTEAAKKSGAKITVKYALEEGREVFAVPGSIKSDVSKGTNELISQGANVLTSVEDIFECLNWDEKIDQARLFQDFSDLNKQELEIFKITSSEPKDVSVYMENMKINIKTLVTSLSNLELKGLIKNVSGKYYK